MIFVDSNLFVIDLRYPRDRNHRINRTALDRLAREANGVTSVLNVLEVCGILSFNLSAESLRALFIHFPRRYGVTVLPGCGFATRLPAPDAHELLALMARRMSVKDAEIALAVEQQTANVTAFLTWNAKHFAGKLSVPSLTPREWMQA